MLRMASRSPGTPGRARRPVSALPLAGVLVAGVLVAGVLAAGPIAASATAGAGPARQAAATASPVATSCAGWMRRRPPNTGTGWNLLAGVAVTSRRNAWATNQFLGGAHVLHWNGSSWKFQHVPTGLQDQLGGIAATSAWNALAVGARYRSSTAQYRNLILHWNGRAWSRQATPDPGIGDWLSAVTATSTSNAWAVGYYVTGHPSSLTDILHWNGGSWRRQVTPDPGTINRLYAVAATSRSNAWAVGYTETGGVFQTVILRWNGSSWRRQASPSPSPSIATNTALYGVAATSRSSAWAVGSYYDPATTKTVSLILHWDGARWSRQPSPLGDLHAVAATSGSNAWAVGNRTTSGNQVQALTVHWDGQSWSTKPSPNPAAGYNLLNAVAAASASDVWVVGRTGDANFAARYC
jgi:hypothetical protein